MKFFHINNSLCTTCDRCAVVCPTGAIFASGDMRCINYDKCTSCGSCIKACRVAAISVESLEKMVRDNERIERYRNRIRRLESELTALEQRNSWQNRWLDGIIAAIPYPCAVTDSSGIIKSANSRMGQISVAPPVILDQLPPNLAGENIFNLLPDKTSRIIRTVIGESEPTDHFTVIDSREYNLEVHPLPHDAVMVSLVGLGERNLSSERALGLLRSTIERKMDTVRRIGELLGEETSQEIRELNTVIKIVSSGIADE